MASPFLKGDSTVPRDLLRMLPASSKTFFCKFQKHVGPTCTTLLSVSRPLLPRLLLLGLSSLLWDYLLFFVLLNLLSRSVTKDFVAFPSESRRQFSNIQECPLFTSGAGLLRFHCNGLFMHLALPLDWEFPEYLRPQDWRRAEWGLFPCITSFLNYTIIVSIFIIVLASAFVRESS